MDIFGERKTLYDNIEDMIRFSRNEEKKKESSQIGLFDMGMGEFDEKFHLTPAQRPFSFEEKLFKEKEVLGFMVSGHPLDSLGRYCQRRSNNIRFLKMSLEELAELKEKSPEQFEKDTKNIILKATGIITDIRKIVTKTGKNMMFLTCEGFDYDFEVTIYQKDFEEYKNKVAVGKIIIIDGQLSINLDYGRKTINLRSANIGSLTQVRAQARDMGLLDNSRRLSLQANKKEEEDQEIVSTKDETLSKPSEDFEGELEEKLEVHTGQTPELLVEEEKKYIIDIPSGTKIEQIHALKDFLASAEP